MKKGSLILILILIFNIMSVSAEVYNYPGAIPKDSAAYMEPYFIASNSVRYSPWFKSYIFQTKEEQQKGKYGGEGGQVVMALEMSPANENRILLGSDMSQGYLSTDGGKLWKCLETINTWAIADIKWHPTDENTVYVIQSARNDKDKGGRTSYDGLYKSTDGGETYVQVLEKLFFVNNGSENLIQIDENKSVYVLSSEGVYKSKSKGLLWECLTPLPKEDEWVWSLSITPDGQKIAAAYNSGILYSEDFGKTWTVLENPDSHTNPTCAQFDPDNSSRIFAVYNGEYQGKVYNGGLYVTENIGKSWEKIPHPSNNNGKNKPVTLEFGAKRTDGTRTMYLAYDDMSYPLRMSEDYGKTWRTPTVHREGNFIQATGYSPEGLALSPGNPDVAYYSFGDIIYKTEDAGRNFEMMSSGYSVACVNDFTFTDDGRIFFSFVDKGIGVTDEPYKNGCFPTAKMLYAESGLTLGTSQAIIVNPENRNDMISNIGAWSEGDFVRTFDGGKNWIFITDGQGNRIRGTLNEGSCFYPEKNIIYTTTHTSYDMGKTWTENERDNYVSPANKNVVYSATEREFYRSDDCGKTWKLLGSNLSNIFEVAPDLFDENVCRIGCYNGSIIKFEGENKTVYGELSGLSSWGGITYTIMTIGQNPKDKNHLLAGGKVTHQGLKSPGMYESHDGGETWEIVPGMPGAKMFHSFAFSPVSDEVFVGTMGGGTFIYEYNNYKKYKEGTLDLNSFEPLFETEEKYTDGKIRVKINGILIAFDVDPFTVNDRTMVPMRKIFEVLGATVTWEDATQTVGATLGDTNISLSIGSTKAYVNGEEKTLDAAAMLKDSRTLVPLRFVSEALGCKVDWDGENNLVKITK